MIKEIIDFQEANLWKNINDGDTIKEMTLIGKYIEVQGKEKSWEYLADINMKIVALKEINNEDRIKLENGKIYKIIGELKKYKTLENPKGSNQLKVKEIEKVEDENIYLNTLKRKEEILKRKKIDILGVIKKKIVKKEKINLLYIVSKNFTLNNKKRDILNDLYLNESEKKILKYDFGLDFENESNIIRMKLETSEFFDKKRVLSEIRKKQKNKKIDGLVFIKGGGNDLDYFDDIVFCEKIVELGVPFITAIGHTNDNDLLLSQLSDANYNTPTRLGIGFLEIYNSIYSEDIKEELGSAKTKNVIFMFIIVILLGYSIFSTFFMKREVKEKNETTKIEEVSREKNIKIEEVKKEEKNNTTKNTLKENLNNLKEKIITPEKKESNNQKNISTKKVENKSKKLIYSEDYLYTVLSWKGYRGERAIQEFQRDNGMKVTGKVDENLLKKLGIKIEYK
ncbi:peptidoglycan-binding domain-containing protein [Fusobacterium sp.]|uniref:peptidoglycan-binding domain-containing protein n=1 Tax=Fusobacterium sp. TaxID=68766 RepID=UPI0025DE4D60|nr:peptidoglycan-binding domain-containing protein [Fusobacterium sp.]MDY3059784.1 peptidoglycan-binding domain-containing protein [Fusobacterium sp.]MEE1477236.1 peptidoglycan-binding domain-containing protein [Fusobacterium sp.]